MWSKLKNPFGVTRHNSDIREYATDNSVATGIGFNPSYEQWDACIASGLSIQVWESGGYPPSLMAKVVAWHRLHTLVQSHKDDAVSKEIKRRNRVR